MILDFFVHHWLVNEREHINYAFHIKTEDMQKWHGMFCKIRLVERFTFSHGNLLYPSLTLQHCYEGKIKERMLYLTKYKSSESNR